MYEKETELMLSLSIYVILECPTTVCDFLSWIYSHALQVKPVYDYNTCYFPPAFDEPADHKENHTILIPPW